MDLEWNHQLQVCQNKRKEPRLADIARESPGRKHTAGLFTQ